MEGPASAAYVSSLQVQSGEVESVYNQNQNDSAPDTSEDVNAEINAAETEDEYKVLYVKNIMADYLQLRFKLKMQQKKDIMMEMTLTK